MSEVASMAPFARVEGSVGAAHIGVQRIAVREECAHARQRVARANARG